jgi:glycosyltransferase involved in cell wall biosynthesis
VIFISEATKNTVFYKSNLLDRDNMQALIIQNGVPVFESNKFYTKSKKILDVAVISRIEEYKGHLDLVSAYDKLQKKYKDKLKFHFIGSGDDLILNNLKSFISKTTIIGIPSWRAKSPTPVIVKYTKAGKALAANSFTGKVKKILWQSGIGAVVLVEVNSDNQIHLLSNMA